MDCQWAVDSPTSLYLPPHASCLATHYHCGMQGIPSAPTFYPTEEEFADPLKYIDSIRPEAEKCGIACVVPPKGWAPPFSLDKGTNGQHSDSFRFSIRKQLTSHLCTRLANTKTDRKKKAAGRYACVTQPMLMAGGR